MPQNWYGLRNLGNTSDIFNTNLVEKDTEDPVNNLLLLPRSINSTNTTGYGSSRSSIISLGSSNFGSPDSGASNGLSSWYDNLRNDPAILHVSSSSSRSSSMSISSSSRTVSESEPYFEDSDYSSQCHTENIENELENMCIEECSEISNFLKNWVMNLGIANGDPFYGLDGLEYSPINSRKAVRTDPYHNFQWETRSQFQYEWDGPVDKEGKFNGKGSLKFVDGGEVSGTWKNGRRVGKGTTSCLAQKIRLLSGEYKAGKLIGIGRIVYENGNSIEGYFRDGCLHGLARKMGINRNLMWVGRYLHGLPVGTCWEFLPVGGCVVGQVESSGKLSGDSLTYIYPDWMTCLVGSFKDSVLTSGQVARVQSASISKGILEIKTSSPEGPQLTYELSTRDKICSKMLHRDPYEEQMVDVKTSGAAMAGEGVFALKDIPANTVVAFYNGIRIPANEEDTEDSWDDCSYRIFVAIDDGTDIDNDDCERMDMPGEFSSTEIYCATVAHKINHSFNPNCRFSKYIHPMFGPVPCVITSQDVAAGEELFTYYKYLLSDCPEWYSSLWESQ